MSYLKTNDTHYVIDRSSTAVLNIDKAGYEQFKKEREQAKEVRRLTQQVSRLNDDVSDIKALLQQLINGTSK